MKNHPDLLTVRKSMVAASRQYDSFIVFNTWGLCAVLSVIFSVASASLFAIMSLFPPEQLASASSPVLFSALAVGFFLLYPLAKRLEEGKRKPLETLCRGTTDAYVNALKAVLEFNGYVGEFVALNDPASSQYQCFADRHGEIVTITVEGYDDMLLFQEDGHRVELYESA